MTRHVVSSRPDNSLTSIADELYGVVPEQFVSVRDDRIKAARDSGDRTLAAAIRSLREPTVAAFAVNLLVRERRAAVEELLALGDALREAQQELSPTELGRCPNNATASCGRSSTTPQSVPAGVECASTPPPSTRCRRPSTPPSPIRSGATRCCGDNSIEPSTRRPTRP